MEDKRRIGSDMTNPNMGHLVQGTAVAQVHDDFGKKVSCPPP